MNVTHQQTYTITSLLAFDNGTMDVGDHGTSVSNIVVNLRNDGMCSHHVVNVRNGSTRAPRHRMRRFSRRTGYKRQMLDPFLIEIADLA